MVEIKTVLCNGNDEGGGDGNPDLRLQGVRAGAE